MDEKIVITGMGTINALGHNVEQTWENAVNAHSGVGPITRFDTSEFLVKVACEVKDFNPADYIETREVRRRDRYEHFSAVAVKEALEQSGLKIMPENAGRVGVILSAAIGGLGSLEQNVLSMAEGGPRKVSPFLIPMLMSNGAAGLVGIDHGPKGPSFSVVSACASGQDGIGVAWMLLRTGVIDVCITGAAEATVTPLGIAAFDRLQATSRRAFGDPTPRPFDKERDGLVVGEGSAILVLERAGHARARKAEVLAELAGYASTADAFHVTAPSADGSGGAAAMLNALELARVDLDEVGYISAHGTATQLNDVSETQAIKTAFGAQAYKIPISSTKSMTGHMMGATGALETIFCVQALRNNVVPPTINYHTPDPECDLDYVPNEARQVPVSAAISNSFGFGGHNAVLVLREYNGAS